MFGRPRHGLDKRREIYYGAVAEGTRARRRMEAEGNRVWDRFVMVEWAGAVVTRSARGNQHTINTTTRTHLLSTST